MHVSKSVIFLMFCSLVVLAWAGGASAILVEDYVGIRILEPADARPTPEDPEGCRNLVRQECVDVGPAYPAGISDGADVFGHYETNHPHEHHWEQGITWLRRDGYKGDFLESIPLDPKEWDFCAIDGRSRGLHGTFVSPEGIATGRSIPGAYHIDLNTGKLTIAGNGELYKASGNSAIAQLADAEQSCATNPYGHGVVDVSLVQDPPTQADHGELHRLPDVSYPRAINDRHVIVGSVDPTCSRSRALGRSALVAKPCR